MKLKYLLGILLLFPALYASRTSAQSAPKETKVMIRVLARDAKLIGKSVGGARVTIKDATTGQVLAQGMEQDGTGETSLIVENPRVRGEKVYDTPGASGFIAELNLERPTVVEISAEGPLGSPQATQRSSKTLLLVPGEDVLGEGVILEIHGFIVKTMMPQASAKVSGSAPFEVRATVNMACGCPTEPGGHWDSNKFRVVARLMREGTLEAEIPMHYAGVQNTYTGSVPKAAPGPIELQVLALDPANANFGLTREDLTILP